jgi:hypothetical protein
MVYERKKETKEGPQELAWQTEEQRKSNLNINHQWEC